MHGKEFVLDVIRTYFTVVVLINVAMYAMGVHFAPEHRFGYEAFRAPLIYGAAGTLPLFVMYSKRELKVGELIIRHILQFVLIEVFVLFVAFYGTDEAWVDAGVVGSVAISIFIIYLLSFLFDWLQNWLSAKRISEDLRKFQERMKE